MYLDLRHTSMNIVINKRAHSLFIVTLTTRPPAKILGASNFGSRLEFVIFQQLFHIIYINCFHFYYTTVAYTRYYQSYDCFCMVGLRYIEKYHYLLVWLRLWVFIMFCVWIYFAGVGLWVILATAICTATKMVVWSNDSVKGLCVCLYTRLAPKLCAQNYISVLNKCIHVMGVGAVLWFYISAAIKARKHYA